MNDIIGYEPSKLQSMVWSNWMNVRKHHLSSQGVNFLVTAVLPCLQINVRDCTSEMNGLANMFAAGITAKIQQGQPDHVTLKILKGTVSGRLSSDPAIMGIVLQCMDMLKHRERGCGMKGPKNRKDVETDLLEEAALLLTSNGCPGDLMQHFGFSTVSILRTLSNLDTLTSRGLPCPVLACIFQGVMKENIGLIDSLLARPTQNRKRMVMCFDFTCLLPMHCSLTLNKETCSGRLAISDG